MPDSPRQTHRSFTVRVPMARYLKIAELAEESNSNLNVKVNELLELGLKENINIEQALSRLIRRAAQQEEPTNDEA